jgi:tRNA pseudouridine38-40 synthase
MVRRLTGMLAEVGRGSQSVNDFERLLRFHSGAAAAHTAPPSGLYLEKVLYKGDTPPTGREAILRVA